VVVSSSRDRGAGVLFGRLALLFAGASAIAPACGARTDLLEELCEEGEIGACGSNIGACRMGSAVCSDGVFGECIGAMGPTPETCNDIDDDCDGKLDEDFGVGKACDGPDSDGCFDDVMTCLGCSSGPNDLESCNGKDDDCDGDVDTDCEIGSCSPTLLVTGSTPSRWSCVDFPIEKGTQGAIEYPCAGGSVVAVLGPVTLTGSVMNGYVFLTGSRTLGPGETPDGCTWRTDHAIQGPLFSGKLTYSYSESFVSGVDCWDPCTEVGTVEMRWTMP
jgi:hypothetical protein